MAERSSLPPEYLNTPRMQWIMATEKLSEQLRTEVSLPSNFTDVESGMCLPKWHSVFEGCTACAEMKSFAEANQEKCIWQHIWNDKKH
eukprot:4604255-Karenia_brevis.AAC.1